MDENNMVIEKEVEKVIKLIFPMYSDKDWDSIISAPTVAFQRQYLELFAHFVVNEKDKMLFNIAGFSYLRKKVFFDIDYNFNDTLNKLKKSTIDLLNILNTT